MEQEQKQLLTERLTQLGYPDFEIMSGEDEVSMLYVNGHMICSIDYALSLSDEELKVLIY